MSKNQYFKRWLEKASKEIKEWLEKENEFLKKEIKLNSRVLDVGCGNGRSLKAISGFCKAVGIDKNKKIILEAKKNVAGVEFLFANAYDLPFKENYFDFVICMGNTFGVIYNADKALQEMERVVKPEGKIILSVYNEKALSSRIENYKKARHKIVKIDEKRTIFTKEGLVSKQFSKDYLKAIFKKFALKFKIINFTPISYLCILSKS